MTEEKDSNVIELLKAIADYKRQDRNYRFRDIDDMADLSIQALREYGIEYSPQYY